MLGDLVCWPKGNPPESHEAEFMEVQVPGVGNFDRRNGLPNRLYSEETHRGRITLHLRPGHEDLTFWMMVVSERIKVRHGGSV